MVLDVLLGGLWSIPGRSAQVETDLDSNIEREEVFKSQPRRLLGGSGPVPGLGAPSPRVLQPSAAGWSLTPAARNVREPLCRVCFFGQLRWTA